LNPRDSEPLIGQACNILAHLLIGQDEDLAIGGGSAKNRAVDSIGVSAGFQKDTKVIPRVVLPVFFIERPIQEQLAFLIGVFKHKANQGEAQNTGRRVERDELA